MLLLWSFRCYRVRANRNANSKPVQMGRKLDSPTSRSREHIWHVVCLHHTRRCAFTRSVPRSCWSPGYRSSCERSHERSPEAQPTCQHVWTRNVSIHGVRSALLTLDRDLSPACKCTGNSWSKVWFSLIWFWQSGYQSVYHVYTYQQGGRGKGQAGVLHPSIWERWRQNQDVILTPNVGSSQVLGSLQHGLCLTQKHSVQSNVCLPKKTLVVGQTGSHGNINISGLWETAPSKTSRLTVTYLWKLIRCFICKLFLRPDSGPRPNLPVSQLEHRHRLHAAVNMMTSVTRWEGPYLLSRAPTTIAIR